MSKLIYINYNGNLGYNVSISDVLNNFRATISPEDFLDLKDEEKNGIKNRDLIFNSYPTVAKIRLNLANEDGEDIKDSKAIDPSMPWTVNLSLFIDPNLIPKDVLISQSNILVNDFQVSDFGKTSDKYFNIFKNVFYEKTIRNNSYDNILSNPYRNREGTYGVREAIKPTVWIWCKSLDSEEEFNDYSIFDLSPFVQNLNINKDSNGGNFSISLTPINGVLEFKGDELEGFWSPDKRSYVKFKNDKGNNYIFREFVDRLRNRKTEDFKDLTYGESINAVDNMGIYSRDRKFKSKEQKTFVNSEKLFKNMILQNDLVFISFSPDIQLRNINKTNEFFIHSEEIPDKNWEMIGMVDSSPMSNNYENVETNLSVNGRDLMKLLIEDGSHFFTKSYTDSESDTSIFKNFKQEKRGDRVNTLNNFIENGAVSANRLITTGIIDILYNPEARNVNFIMNLLMSRLSNIEVAPSDLFRHYGDKITEYAVATYEEENKKSEQEGSRKEDLE